MSALEMLVALSTDFNLKKFSLALHMFDVPALTAKLNIILASNNQKDYAVHRQLDTHTDCKGMRDWRVDNHHSSLRARFVLHVPKYHKLSFSFAFSFPLYLYFFCLHFSLRRQQ